MAFKQSKREPAAPAAGSAAPAVPNLADAQNRQADARRKRLESGGRNATFLASIASAAVSKGAGAVKTLTGLQG